MSDRRIGRHPELFHAARELPHCAYPSAADAGRHGLQPLPDELPVVDFQRAGPYRATGRQIIALENLPGPSVLEAARLVAESFAAREPQCRHLRPAAIMPDSLRTALHVDAFGAAMFGAWGREELLYWFIRSLVLTYPTSPRVAVQLNGDALRQSLAMVDDAGEIIGGALNETMPDPAAMHGFREGDPFIDAMMGYVGPVLDMLGRQDAEAIAAMGKRYPLFRAALANGKVGHHFMVARGQRLPKRDAFELVARSAANYRELGFQFMLVEATNQWTGAACEVLGGVRVHYSPFRVRQVVPASDAALPDSVSSPDGFLAAKDSGSMFYVLRLV